MQIVFLSEWESTLLELIFAPYRFCNVLKGKIMDKNELLNRIIIDPLICHGKPCIRGLRYPVSSILEYLAAGDTTEDILAEFTDLEEEDIRACLAFAVLAVNTKGSIVIPHAA